MKIVLNRKALAGMMKLMKFADHKHVQEIMGHVLLDATDDGVVSVVATDGDMVVQGTLPATVQKVGAVTVPIKVLYDVVRVLEAQEAVTIETDGNMAVVNSGRSKFRMMTLEAQDFPHMPSISSSMQVIPTKVFSRLMRLTGFSVYGGSDRPHLQGIFAVLEGTLARMVSTDSHRMSLAEMELNISLAVKMEFLITAAAMGEIKALLDICGETVQVGVDKDRLYVQAQLAGEGMGKVLLAVQVPDTKFPPYDQLIPKNLSWIFGVDRVDLLEALRRVSAVTADRTLGVRMLVQGGKLTIVVDNPAIGSGEETVDVEVEGDVLEHCFNAKYWIGALAAMDGERVTVQMGEALDPAILKSEDGEYLGVIMPMHFLN